MTIARVLDSNPNENDMNDSSVGDCIGRFYPPGRRRLVRRVLVLSTALVAQACGSDTAPVPAPVSLSGNVILMDSWANVFPDFSGVVVTVDGMTLQAVTDKSGAWRIDSVPTGRHGIKFTKATFGDMRIPALDVAGPTMTAPIITLTIPPWEQAIIDSVYVGTRSGKDYYFVDGHLSDPPPPNARAGVTVVFLSKSAAVSPDTASFDAWNTSFDITGKSRTFSVSFAVETMRSAFAVGAHAFAAAYVASAACGCYQDPVTKKPTYTSIGPRGNVVSLTVQ